MKAENGDVIRQHGDDVFSDVDVFVLNPLFRIYNERDHAIVIGIQGTDNWAIHRSHAIILALFNGNRSVMDVARVVTPFVSDDDSRNPLDIALSHVRGVVRYMSKSKNEQLNRPIPPSTYPSQSVLITKNEYELKFEKYKYLKIEYSPRDFLPLPGEVVGEGPFSSIERSTFPHSINWHVTSDCSVDCRYCYLGRRTVRSMSKQRSLSLVDEMADIGVATLSLLGGDVLLYPHLFELLHLMRHRKFFPVDLSTKSFLSREMAEMLSSAGEIVSTIQFSIDSDDEQITRYLMQVPNYCERIFASIDNALQSNLHVSAKAVITSHNVYTIPQLYRRLKESGVTEIRLATYGRSGFHHVDDLFVSPEQYDWLQNETVNLQTEFPSDDINIQNGHPVLVPQDKTTRKERWGQRSACSAGRSCMMICSDGKVIPCEQMPETEEYFCGDVSYQSIMEVWNGDRLKEMTYGMPREKFKGQPCYDCEEREECHNVMGYCIRDLAAHWGNIYQPPPNCYRHDIPFIRQT